MTQMCTAVVPYDNSSGCRSMQRIENKHELLCVTKKEAPKWKFWKTLCYLLRLMDAHSLLGKVCGDLEPIYGIDSPDDLSQST